MPKDLRQHLDDVQRLLPNELVVIEQEMDPAFEINAILQQLNDQNKFTACLFTNVRNLNGEPGHRVVSNLFASRKRMAVAMGMDPEHYRMEMAIEAQRRSRNLIKPVVVHQSEAPVCEVRKCGDEADLRDFPVIRQHRMDGGHFFTMGLVSRDPDRPIYNASHHRMPVREAREAGICMAPFHTWRIYKENERRGQPTRCVAVQGHHPLFFLGCGLRLPYETDEYEAIGGLLDEPLRLTPSLTWGEEFLIPADAEICIEGELLPNVLKPEGPFGEWTGYYSGQRQGEVFRVTAIAHRRDPILVSVFAGHLDHVSPLRTEAEVYARVKQAVPRVRAVHAPPSGTKTAVYISIDKIADGEPKLAAMAAATVGFLKTIIVVDADVDPFNEAEVLWAVAVRFQAHRDLDIVRDVLGSLIDPSMDDPTTHSMMIIDATEPKSQPYPERLRVPDEVMQRIELTDYIPQDVLSRLR